MAVYTVSHSALRFYDEEGLLPFVRQVNGRRLFEDEDFSWLSIITCLKNTGMPNREIMYYVGLRLLVKSLLPGGQPLQMNSKEK